jgi:hypothetical protein
MLGPEPLLAGRKREFDHCAFLGKAFPRHGTQLQPGMTARAGAFKMSRFFCWELGSGFGHGVSGGWQAMPAPMCKQNTGTDEEPTRDPLQIATQTGGTPARTHRERIAKYCARHRNPRGTHAEPIASSDTNRRNPARTHKEPIAKYRAKRSNP